MNYCVAVALAVGLMTAACRGQANRVDQPPRHAVAWRTVGSWSGTGNGQTESFTSETGALRIHWTTSRKEPGTTGNFRLTAHSAISGRLLEQVVEQQGAGNGVGYVNQDPHVFYLMVESDHLDWKVSVEEAFAGTVTGNPQ